MEDFKLQTEVKIKLNKINYDINIEIISKTDNCIHSYVSAKGSVFDIYIIKDKCILGGYYYTFAIPSFYLSLSAVSKDTNYLKSFLSDFVENKIDCNTLATAIVAVITKFEQEQPR